MDNVNKLIQKLKVQDTQKLWSTWGFWVLKWLSQTKDIEGMANSAALLTNKLLNMFPVDVSELL